MALAPFLDTLVAAPNAASMLRWIYVPGFEVCRALLAGELPVTHAGLDQAAITAPRAAAFLRAKLVDSGVLPDRDAQAASFAAWQQQATLRVAPGVDRAHVRAYATWQVASQLAARERRGEISYTSQKYARSLLSEAIKLTSWLHQQHLELEDLRQNLVDEWVTAGGSTRRRVRMFLTWLARAGVTGALHVAWNQYPASRAALSDNERLNLLARLLYDGGLALSDRLAGCLLLLYAQPLTRIITLRFSDFSITADATVVRLGRGTVRLPEPLGATAREVLRPHVDGVTDDRWLIPGRHAGSQISADGLGQRLRRLGILRAVNGRHSAMLALAGRLPASILAERIGVNQGRATNWSRLAGATYGDYVNVRHADLPPGDARDDRAPCHRGGRRRRS